MAPAVLRPGTTTSNDLPGLPESAVEDSNAALPVPVFLGYSQFPDKHRGKQA